MNTRDSVTVRHQLWADNGPMLRRFVERLAAGQLDQAVIEEIVSIVFERIGNVPPRTDVKTLLFKRAFFLTKKRIPPQPELTPEEAASLRAEVGNLLDQLSPPEVEIIRLIDMDGHTAESAARVLHVNPITAAWRYRKAYSHIRRLCRAKKT